MSRTLEPTLYSLLPSYSTTLPQPLVELASSLLAQSRHSAGTLKADEEIARSYACAHLACERLKISLDLPPIQARPPIPPRLYKRLYSHLDNVLISSTSQNGKSGRTRMPTSKAREAQRVPSRATPTKDSSLAKFRPAGTQGNGTPTKSPSKPPLIPAKRKAGGAVSALPAWVRPTIQLLCTELDHELIGSTVLAGMQTVVAPHGRRTNDSWVNDHLTPLLAALYCFVAGQLQVLVQGKDLDNRQYAKIRKSILGVLEHAQEKVAIRGMDEDELWIGWAETTTKDVDAAMSEIIKKGWQKDEWFAGFEEAVKRSEASANKNGDEDGANETGDIDDDDGEHAGTPAKFHIQKPDTMIQSRWELTDQKRREFQDWKAGILQRIEDIERSTEPTSPEIGVTA